MYSQPSLNYRQQNTSMKHANLRGQVGNLLRVLRRHQGQFIVGREGKVIWSLNPLRRDGGIHSFYGIRFYASQAECQTAIDRLIAREGGNYHGYCVVNVEDWVMQTVLLEELRPLRALLVEHPDWRTAEPEPHWLVRLWRILPPWSTY